MDFKFHTHNINLFAYFLSEKVDGLGKYPSDWLWDKCDSIVTQTLKTTFNFHLKDHLDLENQPEEAWANLNKHFPKTDDYHPIYVQPDKAFIENSTNINLNSKTATIFPVQLYDSYGFAFNLATPQNANNSRLFNITDIKLANPNNCLILDVNRDNNYFLDQTLFITIDLELLQKLRYKVGRDKLKRIADRYIESLLPENFRKPPFNRSGTLFGSPIFEYGIIRASQSYSHIIVWFVIDDKSVEKFDTSYQQLLDLFFFRAKVIHAYKQIRSIEKEAKKKSKDIQSKIKDTQIYQSKIKTVEKQKEPLEVDLDKLLDLLTELPKFSVEYAENIRIIKEFQNIIVENTRNYTDKIHEIASNFADEDLSFLRVFTDRTCHPFQDRVTAAVNFFQLDINLVDNAIDSIRGQVAIEQARRERELQARITGLGIGIAAAGTVAGNLASSYEASAIRTESAEPPHDWYHFGLSILISTMGGLFVALVATFIFTKMNRILLHRLQLFVKSKRKVGREK